MARGGPPKVMKTQRRPAAVESIIWTASSGEWPRACGPPKEMKNPPERRCGVHQANRRRVFQGSGTLRFWVGGFGAQARVLLLHLDHLVAVQGDEYHAAGRLAEDPVFEFQAVLHFARLVIGPAEREHHLLAIHALGDALFLDGLLHFRRQRLGVNFGGGAL